MRLPAWLLKSTRAGLLAGLFAICGCILSAAPPENPPAAMAAQIVIEARFIEVAAGKFPAAIGEVADEKRAAEIMRALAEMKGADVLSSPRVVTPSGRTATIQIGSEQKTADGVSKFVGITLEMVPEAVGEKIKLQANARMISPAGKNAASGEPLFHERGLKKQITLRDRASAVFGKMPADKPGREVFILMSARLMPVGGDPVAPERAR